MDITKIINTNKSVEELSEKEFINLQLERLTQLRNQLLGRMEISTKDMIRNSGDRDGVATFGTHQGDAGSDTYDCDFALNMLSKENNSVKEIEEALERIKNETYGICIDSGEKIPRLRLEAIPFAKRTVKCQQEFENNNKKYGGNLSPISDLFQKADISYDIVKEKKQDKNSE